MIVGRRSLPALRRRHLDVIADHVVVADLAALATPVCLGVARLQRGDHAAAVVAQLAQLVELGAIARRDEAAVAREQRQVGGERAAEAVDERVVLAEPRSARRRASGSGTRLGAEQHRAQVARSRRAPSRRAARSRGPPRPRPRRVSARSMSGQRRSRVAQLSRRSARSTKNATASSRARDRGGSVSGAARCSASSRAPAPVSGAVDGRQAGCRARSPDRVVAQFEVAPRRRVDLHHRAGRDALRRRQMRRQPALAGSARHSRRARRRRRSRRGRTAPNPSSASTP